MNYQFQGLIPKRRNELAKSIGNTIEKELVSVEEVLDRIMENQDKREIINGIKDKVQRIVTQKIPLFIPGTFKDLILNYIEDILEEELEPAMDELIEELMNRATSTVKIGGMVENKINEFDLLKLESIIINISRRELKQIEYLGGLLGLFIGALQGLIILFI